MTSVATEPTGFHPTASPERPALARGEGRRPESHFTPAAQAEEREVALEVGRPAFEDAGDRPRDLTRHLLGKQRGEG